ncbi:MgtC/SapB family protein [Aquibacillus sediminis]|uniref:MgtC/SapB family protein n=1 Tax=Aquibacillus sediminis TaxID=2574734 RepID=UPI001108FC4E|nr:MgtC/SapB family protein [Aquibacillus sediminis]
MPGIFNDVFNDQFLLMISRIFIALALSGLIGFERELKNRSAGFRTHILVGVGSCLMMLLSLYGFEAYIEKYENVRFDPARIPSYVISGIGFLGAGTIIVNGMTIRGLTTAASIWAVAGLGLVVGAGMYSEAVFTTLVILLSLVFLNNLENRFLKGKQVHSFQVVIGPNLDMETLLSVVKQHNNEINKFEIEQELGDDRNLFIRLENTSRLDKYKLYDELSKVEHVRQVSDRE